MTIETNDEAALVADVARRLGASADDDVEHVVVAVLDALGDVLSLDEARLIAAYLPGRWSALLVEAAQREVGAADVHELVEGVAWRENIARGWALEHATAVCEAVGRLLPDHVEHRLHADLPSQLAALLEPRYALVPPVRRSAGRPQPAPRTLATGRARSAHPLSEARPEIAHSESVARSSDPHADTKLSGARGLTQERFEESLATGSMGPRRTLAGS